MLTRNVFLRKTDFLNIAMVPGWYWKEKLAKGSCGLALPRYGVVELAFPVTGNKVLCKLVNLVSLLA